MQTTLQKFEMFETKPFRHQLRFNVERMPAVVSVVQQTAITERNQNEHVFAFSRNWTLSGVVTKEADLRFWTLVCLIGKNDNLIALYMTN